MPYPNSILKSPKSRNFSNLSQISLKQSQSNRALTSTRQEHTWVIIKTAYEVVKVSLFLTMVHIMKETGKMTTCQVMVDLSSLLHIMKVTLETVLPMVKATMKILTRPFQVNGEMTWGMASDKNSSRIKRENIPELGSVTNIRAKGN